ncbi:MAG: nicotinate-nucleotide--dimethylbenzimidazole phosphoribosyltransferase, partial [Sulfitobacter sp.]|nr:nicotinate-nucleotide--dimethylbenzimidazole phosphoribosyltransferase [Sulfitobacter sp.]
EMGIANTTAAAALSCALLGGDAADWTGRGTGVDDAGLSLKTQVVGEGVALHKGQGDGIETLRRLGGRELAGMVGATARARHLRIPVILDGYICTSAALTLSHTQEGALDHAVAGHLSPEGGHARMLEALGKEPLLQLGMRLGEASGGALAIAVLKGAMACHAGMATFAQAGVSDG